jgi:hypothetical protein
MRRKLTMVNDECRRGSLRSLIAFTAVRVVDLVPRKMSPPDSVERALILPGKA